MWLASMREDGTEITVLPTHQLAGLRSAVSSSEGSGAKPWRPDDLVPFAAYTDSI